MTDKAPSILIVEDAEDIGASIVDLLMEEGYDVAWATNGRAALTQLEASERLPNLILLDLMMPEMDGHEFRREQRSRPRLAEIPVLLMTAGGEVEAKAKELGAVGFLKKPFKDLDTIVAAVKRFL